MRFAMELRFLTSDLLTLISLFNSCARRALGRATDLSLNDYRIASCVRKKRANSIGSLSDQLSIAPSRVSAAVNGMVDRGYISKKTSGKMSARLRITPGGEKMLDVADGAVEGAHEALLAPLSPAERQSFDAGFLATAGACGELSYRDQLPHLSFIYVQIFIHIERLITESTRCAGMGYVEFRVLLALLGASSPLAFSEIRRLLVLSKSTVSEAIVKLEERGLVASGRVDGRAKLLALTEEGREVASALALEVDSVTMRAFRPIRKDERAMYGRLSSLVAAHARRGGG